MAGSELILSVSTLNDYANSVLSNDVRLRSVKVRGELTGVRLHASSGHIYFALKDEEARISCVMFRSSAAKLRINPRDGLRVVVSGSVSIYRRDGQFQLYAVSMREEGEGEQYRRFLELRDRLEAEGLFLKKRRLPFLPKCVGIVTSESGAAFHDIVTVIRRRFPTMNMLFAPASVQGAEAPRELIAALRLLDDSGIPDVIIIGRGGGSSEDLACFNDEALARAIYACRTPTVSAVGHEIDFTIADFAADRRAPTPSAAAEICVPELEQLGRSVEMLRQRLRSIADSSLRDAGQRMKLCMSSRAFAAPRLFIDSVRGGLDALRSRLDDAGHDIFAAENARLAGLEQRLCSLDPGAVLGRGYAMVLDESGVPVSDIGGITLGAQLGIAMSGGTAEVTVNSVSIGGNAAIR